jgi:hypothetical protein
MPVTSGSATCPALTPSIWAGVSLTGAARAAEVIRPSANAEAKIVLMVLFLSWWMPVTGLGQGVHSSPSSIVGQLGQPTRGKYPLRTLTNKIIEHPPHQLIRLQNKTCICSGSGFSEDNPATKEHVI